MPFIGNQPALSYTSFAKQDFTTSATTSYTLDNPVANENEIALFINFVRQEPTTAYTASGTSLTLTSATSASDDMYCVFLGKAIQTVNPPNGSVGLSQLSATGTPSSSTFLRGDNSWVAAGGTNTPAFYATRTSNQSISNSTTTTVIFDSEDYDTDTAYDTSTGKFTIPSGKAGKYFLSASVRLNTSGAALWNMRLYIQRTRSASTSAVYQTVNQFSSNIINNYNLNIATVVDAQVGDDYFVQTQIYNDNGAVQGGGYQNFFTGFKIIE